MNQTHLITAPFKELWQSAKSVVVIDGIGLDGKLFIDDKSIDVHLVKSPEILCQVTDAEFAEFQNICELIFQDLIHELNRVHGTNHPDRYWRIVCGAWFLQFAQVWYLRWKVAGVVYSEFGALTCSRIEMSWQELLPVTHDEASLLFATDIWNHFAYLEAFKFVAQNSHVESVVQSPQRNSELTEYRSVIKHGLPSQQPKSKLESLLAKLSPNPKVVLAGIVQSKLSVVVMHLRLGALPRLWRFSAKLTPQPIDENLRSQFMVGRDSRANFAGFLSRSIRHHMPTIYLEGYSDLVTKSLGENILKKAPKAIFTNTLLARSEQFKVWCATLVCNNKTKLFSGQHGGGYLVSKFPNWTEIYEHSIVDRFLAWGSAPNSKVDLASCVQSRFINYSPNFSGNLLLVLGPVTRQQNNFNLGNVHSNSSYYQFLGDFINALDLQVLDKTVIRPKSANPISKPARVSGAQISGLFNDAVNIDDGRQGLEHVLSIARLSVVTYNETTIPTNLMVGFPTIALWDSKYVRLNPTAEVIYNTLRDAKIVFDSPLEAARHITEIWSDVDKWWNSPVVRTARENYCNNYAHQSRFPALTVASVIADNL